MKNVTVTHIFSFIHAVIRFCKEHKYPWFASLNYIWNDCSCVCELSGPTFGSLHNNLASWVVTQRTSKNHKTFKIGGWVLAWGRALAWGWALAWDNTIHTFLCFLFSLAILSFPSLLPSSIPLPAPLLLLLTIAPTGSSTWCNCRWRKVCSTCRVKKGEHERCLGNLERFWPCDACQHSGLSWSAAPQAYSILCVNVVIMNTQMLTSHVLTAGFAL